MAGVEISEEQALAFRARRHHLWGPGAAGPAAAARAVVGIQAQQLPPALWALSMRTAGRPTAAGLATAQWPLVEQLVRVMAKQEPPTN